MAIEPWAVGVVLLAGGILLWRFFRGAHSWAQVGTFWLATVAAILVVVGLAPVSRVIAVCLSALGWAFAYAFGMSRSTARPADAGFLRERLAAWPSPDRSFTGRVQSALLLYVVLQAVVLPVLFLSGHLGGLAMATAVVLLLVVLVGGSYLIYRSMPKMVNPFDRRGQGFASWLWTLTSGIALIPLRRLPWRAPPRRRRARGAH